MKERPILMNAFSVRAILDGRKTMTRRVMKPQLTVYSKMHRFQRFVRWKKISVKWPEGRRHLLARCPYGVPGDRLWVRETWFPMQDVEACALANEPVDVAYKADYDAEGISREEARDIGIDRWRPSRFMPRWVSRIMLEITDVRVERVQDISMHDALREGADPKYSDFQDGSHCVGWFRRVWDEINDERGFGWDANPWVFAISFQKLD